MQRSGYFKFHRWLIFTLKWYICNPFLIHYKAWLCSLKMVKINYETEVVNLLLLYWILCTYIWNKFFIFMKFLCNTDFIILYVCLILYISQIKRKLWVILQFLHYITQLPFWKWRPYLIFYTQSWKRFFCRRIL